MGAGRTAHLAAAVQLGSNRLVLPDLCRPGHLGLRDLSSGELAHRTGLDREGTTILDVTLPKITVPLNPGKNITVIAEVIAMNHLLKYSGIDPAERFNERLMKTMRAASEVRRYLQEDYE